MSAILVPSGAKGNFILGAMPDFNRDSLGFIERIARDYGDIVRTRFFYVPAYFIYHPDYIEQVLATDNKNFIKPLSFRTPFFQRLVGNGLLTSEGDFWRRQRRLAQPAFHRERISAYGQIMVRDTLKMLDAWRDRETLDVHAEM